jgi:hypothetical protein
MQPEDKKIVFKVVILPENCVHQENFETVENDPENSSVKQYFMNPNLNKQKKTIILEEGQTMISDSQFPEKINNLFRLE